MERERLIDYVLGRLSEHEALEVKALAERDVTVAETLQTLRAQLRDCTQYSHDNIALTQALRRELSLQERAPSESRDSFASTQSFPTESGVSLYPLESLFSNPESQEPQGAPSTSSEDFASPDSHAPAVESQDAQESHSSRDELRDSSELQGNVPFGQDLSVEPKISALDADTPSVAPKNRRSRRFTFIPKRVSAPSRRDHEHLIYKRATSVDDSEKRAHKQRKSKRSGFGYVDSLGLGVEYWNGSSSFTATGDCAFLLCEAYVGDSPEYDSTQFDVQCDVNAYRFDDVELSASPTDEFSWHAPICQSNSNVEETNTWGLLHDYFEGSFQTSDAFETSVHGDSAPSTLYLPYGQTERFWSQCGEPTASYALNPYRFTLAQTKSIFKTIGFTSATKRQGVTPLALRWGVEPDVYRRTYSQFGVDPNDLFDAFDSALGDAWYDAVSVERKQNLCVSEVVAPWLTDTSLTLGESVEMPETHEVCAQTTLEQLLESVGLYSVVDAPYTFDVSEDVALAPVFALRPLDEPTLIPSAWSSRFAQDASNKSVDSAETIDAVKPVVAAPETSDGFSLTETSSMSADDVSTYKPILADEPDFANAPVPSQSQYDDVMDDIAAYFGLDGVIIPQELATYISVDRDDEDEEEFGETLSAEDRRLAELLGRRPTLFDYDEYYWEEEKTISTQAYSKRLPKLGLFGRMVKFVFDVTTLPPVLVGRLVIACFRSLFGDDVPQAQTGVARRRGRNAQAPARLSDMFISTAVGILIAVCVVFPALRYAVQEVVTVITASKVRQFGESVPISPNHSEADLLPFLSEHMLYPHYEAVEISGDGTGASYENMESDGYPVIIE
ncbi:MAG: hypothetical protein Q4G03_07330 [Planctomycetia bacterium]|nr:hypothetical protein [Planctomycetia bacterium]